jgi:hypothetical protein
LWRPLSAREPETAFDPKQTFWRRVAEPGPSLVADVVDDR